jgi:hypothetical protein
MTIQGTRRPTVGGGQLVEFQQVQHVDHEYSTFCEECEDHLPVYVDEINVVEHLQVIAERLGVDLHAGAFIRLAVGGYVELYTGPELKSINLKPRVLKSAAQPVGAS